MSLLLRSRPRYRVLPETLAVEWGHPLSHGLVRAYAFATAAPGLVQDLCGRDAAGMVGTVRDDEPGRVWRAADNAHIVTVPDAPDLTPVVGQGLTVVSWLLMENTGLNQICFKTTSGLGYEWLLGQYSSGRIYGIIYSAGASSAYLGRNAPGPSINLWHTVALAWTGATASGANNVRLYVDALRVDDTDYNAGTLVSVSDTVEPVRIGGVNAVLGGTTGMRVALTYIWLRYLQPDELAWLADDPCALLTVPRQRGAPSAGTPAGRGALTSHIRNFLTGGLAA